MLKAKAQSFVDGQHGTSVAAFELINADGSMRFFSTTPRHCKAQPLSLMIRGEGDRHLHRTGDCLPVPLGRAETPAPDGLACRAIKRP